MRFHDGEDKMGGNYNTTAVKPVQTSSSICTKMLEMNWSTHTKYSTHTLTVHDVMKQNW